MGHVRRGLEKEMGCGSSLMLMGCGLGRKRVDFNERRFGLDGQVCYGMDRPFDVFKGSGLWLGLEYQEESNRVGLRLVWSLSLEGCRAGKGRSLARKKLMVCLQETKI